MMPTNAKPPVANDDNAPIVAIHVSDPIDTEDNKEIEPIVTILDPSY